MPKPAQPVAELLPPLEQLGKQGGCARAVKLINPANLLERGRGATPVNCRSLERLISLVRGIKINDSAEFKTAAVIDGTVGGGKQHTLTAALDSTRHFKLTGLSNTRRQVGTKPGAQVDFKGPAAAFVKALRDGDCQAAHAAVAPFSRLAYRSEKEFCSRFDATYMAKPAGLGARLRADPGAGLIDLGGTRDTHFFGLATKPAGYRTIVVGMLENGDSAVTESEPVER